jgi:uncharacterized membrane protein
VAHRAVAVKIALSSWAVRIRTSLFFVPLLYVVGALVLAQVALVVDDRLALGTSELPLGLGSTVQSARAVLGTVAGATITVAGIAFSVSLLVIQQASSQYSPRVLTGLFRDGFNKRVIGITVGTFTYCLVVLRAVHQGVGQQNDPSVPNVAVGLGVLLGIVSILAVIAFISHNAHAMEISQILHVLTADALAAIDANSSFDPLEAVAAPTVLPPIAPRPLRAEGSGWVQLIDRDGLLRALPEGSIVRLEIEPGDFVLPGTTVADVWPPTVVEDDDLARAVRSSVRIGPARTLHQDPGYGMRQLADVGLRALSPGVNDPTTAQDAIFHLAVVVREWIAAEARPTDLELAGRRLRRRPDPSVAELLTIVFGELRRSAAAQPRVCEYLVRAFGAIESALPPDRRAAAGTALRDQIDAVVAECAANDPAPADLARVRAAARLASDELVG